MYISIYKLVRSCGACVVMLAACCNVAQATITCVEYDPNQLVVSGALEVTSRGVLIGRVADKKEALRLLELAKANKKRCFVEMTELFISKFQFWQPGRFPASLNQDLCVKYDPLSLQLQNSDTGWKVVSRNQLITVIQSKNDAERVILELAKYNTSCVIRPELSSQQTSFGKDLFIRYLAKQ